MSWPNDATIARATRNPGRELAETMLAMRFNPLHAL
jgi:hypothetical protein